MRGVNAGKGTLDIGAACTFQELIDNDSIPEYLKETLHFMASRTKRNMATIGGNIAVLRDDSYLLPALMAAGAELDILNTDGSAERILVEDYVQGKDTFKDSLITNIHLNTECLALKSARNANTAQSHARLTASLALRDGEYRGFAAIKKFGIVKMDALTDKFNSAAGKLSEDEIVEFVKNDKDIKLSDDLLYGSADYRMYLLGITFALLYDELSVEGIR